jgi:formylglycine-generating enzyme required for sulfatase activity
MSGLFRCVSASLLVSAALAALPVAFAQEALPTTKGARPLTAAEEAALKPKDSFRECQECPEMVVVPSGSFTMGSSQAEIEDFTAEALRQRWLEEKYAVPRHQAEAPQHEVAIAQPLAVGKFEVTFLEWDACVSAGGCKHTPNDRGRGRGKRPVTNISWHDITDDYLPWLSRRTGKAYRLLSEAEWEYAARAGTTTRFSTGATITRSQAHFRDSGGPIEVGTFPPNTFGVHDMHGNAGEWVQDCWNATYLGAPTDGSAWTTGKCAARVVRGGRANLPPLFHRSAARTSVGSSYPDFHGAYSFRVARTLVR